jgi:ankyrin repeat protein
VCITILIIYYTILCTFSSKDGNTSLLVASRNGHLAVVKELLTQNAKKEATNDVSIILYYKPLDVLIIICLSMLNQYLL